MIDTHGLRPGVIVDGRYRIVEELGVGGMGTVFKAIDLRRRSFVALKVLHRHFASSPERLQRFSRELVTTDRMTSPHIGRSIRSGRDGKYHFLVMEFVEGRSLREIINERSQLPPDEALLVAYQVSKALEAAHSERITHRDIKPENIMITPDGFVRVIDFGIARVADDLASATSAGIWGTAEYLAPEVAKGAWDGGADLYSLGVVLYEMTTGAPPFRGATPWQVEATRQEQKTLSDEQCSLLPPGIVNLTRRLLSYDPDLRPATAGAVCEEIKGLIPDIATRIPVRPSVAQDLSLTAYALGVVASSRRVLGLVGVVLVLLVAGGLILARRVSSSGAENDPSVLLAETHSPAPTVTPGSLPTATVSPVGTPALSPTPGGTLSSNGVGPGSPVPASPSSSASPVLINSPEPSGQSPTSTTPVETIPSQTPQPATSTPVPTPTQLPTLRGVYTFPPIGSPLEQGALVSIRAEFEPGRVDSVFLEWRDDQCVGQSASYALTPTDTQKEFASVYTGDTLPTLSLIIVRLFRSGVVVAEKTLGGC